MDSTLEQAVHEIKSGNKAAGLVYLAQVIRSDPNNESAWIWMATAQDDPEKKKQCLERVLRINPGNERVRRALSVMFPPAVTTQQIAPATVAEPEPQPEAPEKPSVVEVPPVEPEAAAAVIPTETLTPTPEPVEATLPPVPQTEVTPIEPEPAAVEPGSTQVADPDLSWLKETTSESKDSTEEAPDLSWLKEDLPQEEPEQAAPASIDAAPAATSEPLWHAENLQPAEPEATNEEPSLDLSWLKEDQTNEPAAETSFNWPPETEGEAAPSDLSWLKEEMPATDDQKPEINIPPAPTGETDDLAWLRAASAGPASELSSAAKPTPTPAEETDLSWLNGEHASEEKTGVEPFSEPVFPWLNEEAAPTEGQAVKNEDESIPDWLKQGSDEEAEPASAISIEADSSAPNPAAQESPTLETGPLRPEDLDAITAKHADLPFTWDEVTGEPVLKSTAEASEETSTVETGAGPVMGSASEPPDMVMGQTDQATDAASTNPFTSTPISRPRPAAAATAAARDAAAATPAQKKGMSRGQIVLLGLLGLTTLIILLAFAFYLAVNFGWLKAFGF